MIAFQTPSNLLVTASVQIDLPIRFDECVITSVNKPEINDIEYEYGSEDIEILIADFQSAEAETCNYKWSYAAMLAD